MTTEAKSTIECSRNNIILINAGISKMIDTGEIDEDLLEAMGQVATKTANNLSSLALDLELLK